MEDNISQPDAVKTCFGILAIMSREESNKSVIAREGMDAVLNAMTTHIDKIDVQESGCDLLWSLAFNNFAIKELVAKAGGSSVIVRALKRHCRSSEYIKSACGALSNMCQCKLNQDGVATQGDALGHSFNFISLSSLNHFLFHLSLVHSPPTQ